MQKSKIDKIEYVEEGSESFEKKYKKLKKLLKECRKEKQEYLGGWQRSRAEMQNYIKQSEKNMGEFRKLALSDIVLKFLPILDNFSFALDSMPKGLESGSGGEWGRGIKYIKKQAEDFLKDFEVEEIESHIGADFDPARHEAVEEVESKEKSGTIAEVIQGGYTLHGKVIRVAKVKLAK